ncbi:unnamed protein product [Boreogadus saida]
MVSRYLPGSGCVMEVAAARDGGCCPCLVSCWLKKIKTTLNLARRTHPPDAPPTLAGTTGSSRVSSGLRTL